MGTDKNGAGAGWRGNRGRKKGDICNTVNNNFLNDMLV